MTTPSDEVSPSSGSAPPPAQAGTGWRRGFSSSPGSSLRRPGNPATRELPDFEALAKGIRDISEEDDEEALDAAKVLAIEVKEKCDTTEKLTEMMHLIHVACTSSESFAVKTAFLFGCLSQLEVDGVKCRNIFLRKIQEDFASKDERDASSYFNLIVLLCQVFRRVRVADGTTIIALTGPILDSFNDLLANPSDGGLVTLSKQLQIIGPELKRAQPDKFNDLMKKLRICLTKSQNISSPSIASLLLVLELSLVNQWQLTDPMEEFYRNVMPANSRLQAMEVSKPPVVMPPKARSPEAQGHQMQGNLAGLSLSCGEPPTFRSPPPQHHNFPNMNMPPPGMRLPPAMVGQCHQNAPSLFQNMPPLHTQASWGSSSDSEPKTPMVGAGEWGGQAPPNGMGKRTNAEAKSGNNWNSATNSDSPSGNNWNSAARSDATIHTWNSPVHPETDAGNSWSSTATSDTGNNWNAAAAKTDATSQNWGGTANAEATSGPTYTSDTFAAPGRNISESGVRPAPSSSGWGKPTKDWGTASATNDWGKAGGQSTQFAPAPVDSRRYDAFSIGTWDSGPDSGSGDKKSADSSKWGNKEAMPEDEDEENTW